MTNDIVQMREQVIRRSRQIRRVRERRIRAALGSTCALLLVLLLNAVGILNNTELLQAGGLYYGTLMLAPQTGGYVLVGLICFVMGAAVALICAHKKMKKSGREDIV